ncbi:MAG: 4-(cytidine 5'-diphospho)-2-C-methyl-D-erythritol kinase, partial [Acidobacteriota bacterium]
SDVPFFLHGGACLGVGRGDEVVPLPDTDDWHVLVIWPGVTLSTREVYEGLPRALTRSRILSSMKGFNPGRPPRAAGEESSSAEGGQAGEAAQARPVAVQNDLEETVFRRLPHLRRIKQQLLEAGATASALTGSGSAIFGLFGSARGLDRLGKALSGDKVAVFQCRTLSRKAYCFNLFKRS